MAPNRKKKKAASNPARGFATVSQPSKSKDVFDAAAETSSSLETDYVSGKVVDKVTNPSEHEQATQHISEMSPEEFESHLEDAELQTILDAYSARCKQDASKQVNRLVTERRQLRSQAHLLPTMHWLNDELIEAILREGRGGLFTQDLPMSAHNFVDETDLLLKLWTLRAVLEACQFTNIDRAINYLLKISQCGMISTSMDHIWGLREVLEWYAVEGEQQDLPDYEHGGTVHSMDATGVIDDGDHDYINSNKQKLPATISVTETTVNNSHQTEEDRENQVEDVEQDLPPLPTYDSEDDDPSALIPRYVHLQELLFLTNQYPQNSAKQSKSLKQRKLKILEHISSIQRDVLFDADEAERLWQPVLQEMIIESSRSSSTRTVSSKKVEQQETDASEQDDVLVGLFDADGEASGNLDSAAEQIPVRVVDFGRWTGTSPRKLLEESCHSTGAQVRIRFTKLLSTSYSAKQRLTLEGPTPLTFDLEALSALPEELSHVRTSRAITLEMKAVATADHSQAEAYLSTIMLFILVQSGRLDHKCSGRLPTVWRNFYSDLSKTRLDHINIIDKQSLKSLRALLRSTEEDSTRERCTRSSSNATVPLRHGLVSRTDRNTQTLSPQEAKDRWHSRVCSLPYQQILPTREQLPVHKFKQNILQAIDLNQLVIVCADTGAGKSTQVPSFILENVLSRGEDRRILVTQPRRISAISLARRVSVELGEHKNDLGTERSLVGYAIRLESKVSRSTRITFATTGVLLRMIESSPQLEELDYLILDEVHERTMDIDLLFIALRRLLHRRTTLKVVLMSATIDAEKFSTYFIGAPILNVPGRTYPVEIRYLEDAIEDTLDIKMDGKTAATDLEHDDNDEYEFGSDDHRKTTLDDTKSYSNRTRMKLSTIDEYRIDYDLIAALAEAIATKPKYEMYSQAILIFMPGIAEIRRLHNALLARSLFSSNWIVHLLHSSFSTEDLERAFSTPPRGYRKIVIATNIAETGITIPDVTAVIDACKEKVMRFDERRQLSRLTEGFISRSSGRQRRGRAARVQEGLCFHLVTKHRFENLMLEQHVPEMLRLSLQDSILRIKIWDLGSIEETLADAIDPPSGKNVRRAVEKLKDAGALSTSEELTHLGRIIARLPLEVVLSKLAVFGIVFKCLDAVLVIISSLSSKSPFLNDKSGHQADPRLMFARGDSDLISALNAYEGWRKARQAGLAYQYCRKHHLSDQNLLAIEDQKIQLLVYLVDAGLLQLHDEEKAALNRSRTSNARKIFFTIPNRYNTFGNDTMVNCVVAMAFYPKVLLREGKGWRNVYSNQHMSLMANSVNRVANRPPKWLSYYEATQSRNGHLNALETSKIPEWTIVSMLGTSDVKFFSGVIVLDNGRLKFSVRHWRQLAALKVLREALGDVLDRCWRSPGLRLSAPDEQWIETFAGITVEQNAKSE